jgi:hypothetical protein
VVHGLQHRQLLLAHALDQFACTHTEDEIDIGKLP